VELKKNCLSEIENLEKQMAIRFEYINKITESEAKRIDAIRAVDAGAVALASEKAAVQATVLANQVIASAEALRILVASTNIAVAQQLAQVSNQLSERITLLEKSQYENEGRSGLSSPLLMMIAGLTGGVAVFIVQKLLSY
jgi:hypothetical protein